MPKYYLHPVFDVPPILPSSPLVIDTDLTLDLRPGAMILHQGSYLVVLDEPPIQDVQNNTVHIAVCLQNDFSALSHDEKLNCYHKTGYWPHRRS
ncbi:hypothetical protein JD474_13960 [Aeromonas caviae]|uniref:hypothetical protein n=1 Tax=Aeromonas caviae TaxID=648 RepID=UPI00191F8CAF|nr:hypothetical protein [Aeromonas caviae]MBL0530159.1 hypothetical protein [Aeromonas caviae]